jgi:hypothetical protein
MSLTITGVITGGAQTDLTSPTYTAVADQAIDLRSKQAVVTTIGGTQTGVVAHSLNAPFTITIRRANVFKTLGKAFLNGVTGQYSRVPYNDFLLLVRKAAQVASGQWFVNDYRLTAHVAAGSETFDAPNVRAGLSCLVGLAWANSAGMGDTLNNGVLG